MRDIGLASWKRVLLGPADAHVIQIETPQSRHMAVRRALHKLTGSNTLQWDGPTRSPASTGGCKRLMFRVYAPWRHYTDLSVHLLIGRMRRTVGLEKANIVPDALGEAPGAKILEVQRWEAIEDVVDLVQAGMVISPMEIITTTSSTQQAWEQG